MRMVVSLVGIVAIILLGSVFWSSLAAMLSAWNDARSSLPTGGVGQVVPARPAPGARAPVVIEPMPPPATPQPTSAPTPESLAPTPTAEAGAAPTPTEPTAAPSEPDAAPTPAPAGRIPWVLLPQPAPGSHVAAGPVVLEARGRGDAPIAEIRLELDGAPLPAALEQRSEIIWRGHAPATVGPGRHAARAVVVDAEGRSGAYRWSFDADPP